ncbi:MAG: DUF1232 domain-containing protein [Alphaproteobacteria bacterium]|nr:DUF1232 domain-containing protein [Alphaproteobacteria bacterium]
MTLADRAHALRIDAHAVWLAVKDPRTPLLAKLLGIVIAGYALSPIDLIPDFIPILGLVDDVILIPAGIWLMLKLIPKEVMAQHRAEAEAAGTRPVSRTAAVVIALIWLLLFASLGWSLWAYQYW